MKCGEAILLMNAVMDREATPEEEQRLRFHLNGCASCRRTMLMNRAISRGACELQEPDPPADILERVKSRIDNGDYDSSPLKRPFQFKGHQWKIAALIPFAAAALLLFGNMTRNSGTHLPNSSIASVQLEDDQVVYTPTPVVAYSRPSSVTSF